jgi:hypothetical protein
VRPCLTLERSLVRAVGRLERIEDEADRNRVDDRRGAADVIAMRMGDDDHRQPPDPEAFELRGDIGLRRAFVHQHGSRPGLEQDSVSLPDIQHHDAKAGRRRRGMRRLQPPADEDDDQHRREHGGAPTSWRGKLREQEAEQGEPGEGGERLPRGELGVRQCAEETRAARKVGGKPAVHPCERRGGLGKHRVESSRDECQPQERRDDEPRNGVAGDREERCSLEVEHQDRGRNSSARGRDRDHRREPARYRVAGEPIFDAGNEEEDRGDGSEGELKARLEKRIRVPREQHGCADEEEVPAVARTPGQPREGREPARDSCPDDGWLPPDGHEVTAHGSQRGELGDPA